MLEERRWYTVTACRSCGSDTALIVEPPKRYACTSCNETGTVEAGGFQNMPDQRPDSALRVRLSMVLDSPSMKEYVGLCKAYRGRTDHLSVVPRARGQR